jgi:KDO2-lipid IV(A) lauroyltransferase
MYYIIYPVIYLLSLLPWRVLYFISDGFYGLVYYVIGYRKKVVMKNLHIAFPAKTEKERVRIAKDFYHNFTDTFIETIKLLSVSDKEFDKRFTSNIEVVNDLYDTEKNAQIFTGHFFNWEFANLGFAKKAKLPLVFVYLPLGNKAFNKIIVDLRVRYGSIMLSATEFKQTFKSLVKGRYALGLAADQNPGSPDNAYWVPFFNRLTPFVPGPEKGAKANNMACIFGHFYKVKRGYYHFEFEIMTIMPDSFEPGELTCLYVNLLEKAIRKCPANYLWSHRRWKYEFDEEKHTSVETLKRTGH